MIVYASSINRGVNTKDLTGNVRLMVDGIEYGFPTTAMDDTLVVTIPPLDEFIKSDLSEGKQIHAKLDVIANDTYLNPWIDTITVENPVTVEATVSEEIEEDNKPVIDVKMVMEETEEKKVIPKKELKRSKFGKALIK